MSAIGVIGGTGVYDPSIFENIHEESLMTPYGEIDYVQGTYHGKTVIFVARHGKDHTIPPHKINYRANIWGLKKLGVTFIISTTAVGSLNENFKLIIEGAAIKPGRHIRVAKSGDKYIFALPGFPYSAMVMCVLYVRVLINTWFSQEEPKITAIMDEDYKKRSPFLEFTAVNLENRDGKIFVNLNGKKLGSSAIVNNLTNEAALLIIPKETEFIAKGEVVEVLKMPC